MDDLISRVRDIRGRLTAEREAHRLLPPADDVQAAHAEAARITGPFLLGEYDDLKRTDPAAFEQIRLRAVEADKTRWAKVRNVQERIDRLAALEREYQAVAVALADVI